MSSSTPSCNFACAFAGCGRRYAHPDAARKHARRHHAEWVAARDIDKMPCHCIVSGDEAMLSPISRQNSANSADCSIKLLRAAAAGAISPTDELEGRIAPVASYPERVSLYGKGELRQSGMDSPMVADIWPQPSRRATPAVSQTPHAFQLLVAAAIAASDDSSSGDQSPRDNSSEDIVVIAPEPMCC